jgi:ribosomal protein S18 acetylase RimI-like enzyme
MYKHDKMGVNKEAVELKPLDASCIAAVRRLNLSALSIPVQDHVYRDALNNNAAVCSWVAWKKAVQVVGAILLHEEDDRICIRTLAVDIRERGIGIGSALLAKALTSCSSKAFYLHTQVDNTDAIQLYTRMGFRIHRRLDNYYRRLECVDCYVMVRDHSAQTQPIDR